MTATYTALGDTEVVFKLDDWEIQAIDRGVYAFIKTNSIIVHKCSQANSTGNWRNQQLVIVEPHQLSHVCAYCGNRAPDEIQALWQLQNMEHI